MTRADQIGLAAISVMTMLLPSVAQACPMCFTGDNSNSDAFVYGSLLLMFVPVTAIGSLVYWAWRRVQAQDPSREPAPAADLPAAQQAATLRVLPRR